MALWQMEEWALTWLETLDSQLLTATWAGVLVAAALALLAGLLVFYVGQSLLLRLVLPGTLPRHILTAIARPAQWVLPLLALLGVLHAAPEHLRFIDGLRHTTGLLLIAAWALLGIRAIGGLAQGIIARYPVDVADNLQARRIYTQTRVLARSSQVVVLLIGLSFMLMTFPAARQVGTSLLASAGVVGIVAGFAARPLFSNLFSGLQIALAQPIRIDDVLIVKGEWGRVEEITMTYVVLKIWDERRMVIPLQWFIDNPFENWTRTSASLLGSVFLWVDFGLPLAPLRAELERVVRTFPEWDGRTAVLQVTDANDRAMQLRVLVTAPDAGKAFDLRCKVREALIDFLQREYPQQLPRLRVLTG